MVFHVTFLSTHWFSVNNRIMGHYVAKVLVVKDVHTMRTSSSAIAQAVSRRVPNPTPQAESQIRSRRVFSRQNVSGANFSEYFDFR